MSHVLKQYGNNSVTYSFVTTGSGDFISQPDWEALPPSRIKTLLLRTYVGPTPDPYEQLNDALAAAGFQVVLTSPALLGNPIVSLALGTGPLIIGYEGPGPTLPAYEWPVGTRGTLRISVAHSIVE